MTDTCEAALKRSASLAQSAKTSTAVKDQTAAVEPAAQDEALLRALHATSDGIWDFNPQSQTYNFWSERLTGMLGYEDGEIARTLESFRALIHPDDLAPTIKAAERHYARETPLYQAEFRVRHKDGSYRWILSRGVCTFDEDGKPVRMLGSHTDVTEQREAEFRAKALAQHLAEALDRLSFAQRAGGVGMFEWDVQNDHAIWQPELHELYGIPSGSSPGSLKAWTKLLEPEDAVFVQRALDRAFQRKEPSATFEFRAILPDGRRRWLLARAEISYLPDGRPQRLTGVNMDITKIKETQAALYLSESRFRAAQELSLQAFTVLSAVRGAGGNITDFEWQYVNPAAARILHGAPADFVGRRLLSLLPGNAAELFQAYVKVVETGRPHDLEVRYNADGIDGWFRNMAVKLDDGVAVSFLDITEGKRAQEATRANEEHLRIALITGGMGTWVWDVAQGTVKCDGLFKQIWEIDDEGPIPSEKIFERIHPEDLPGVITAESLSLLRGAFDLEFRIVLQNGTLRWVRGSATPLRNAAGHIQTVIGVSMDITERKRSEERLRRLQALSEALSCSMTEDQVANVVLKEGVDATGALAGCVARATDDGNWLEIFAESGMGDELMGEWTKFSTELPAPMAKAARSRQPVFVGSAEERNAMYASRGLRAPFAERINSSAALPLIVDDRLLGVFSLSFEHVQQFNAEEQHFLGAMARQCAQALERARLFAAEKYARAQAEEASSAKDHFLAILSHELRTPLTPVLTSAQMLERQTELNDGQRELATIIRRNVELEARLIEDLLDLTRITRGKLELALSPVNLSHTVEQAVAICESDIQAKGLFVSTALSDRCCVTFGDPARLQQIVWNVLKNAIKFTPPGGAIDIETSCNQKQIMLIVRDTGCGIDPTMLPNLFNAFEQGGKHVTQRFGGLGLGLTITKGLVENHGGTIEIESKGRDQGTLVRLKLPCKAVEAAEQYPAPYEFAEVSPVHARILLVEDNPDTLQLMRRLLESGGYTVQTADGLSSARKAAEEGDFDILISDIGLPDGSGLDLMRELSAKRPVRGIAISGYGMEHDIDRSKQAGFSAHVIKPVDIDTLEDEIKKLLH